MVGRCSVLPNEHILGGKVKGQGQFRQGSVTPDGFIYLFICLYVCDSHNSKSTGPNLMKIGGMIGYYLRTNRLGFGGQRSKVKVKVIAKVKNEFSR